MAPTVGRVVHYRDPDQPSQCYAAVVTDVPPRTGTQAAPSVALRVFTPTDALPVTGVAYDEYRRGGGTWHWPEPAPVTMR
jgi:hypothetical protein